MQDQSLLQEPKTKSSEDTEMAVSVYNSEHGVNQVSKIFNRENSSLNFVKKLLISSLYYSFVEQDIRTCIR